jgi:hypothetical protein
MNQKSSLPQLSRFVSRVLTANTIPSIVFNFFRRLNRTAPANR